jgi:hypothetical protein
MTCLLYQRHASLDPRINLTRTPRHIFHRRSKRRHRRRNSRSITFESLEGRQLLTAATSDAGAADTAPLWQNQDMPCDVNSDGQVDAADATELVAFLNEFGPQPVTSEAIAYFASHSRVFLDVDGDHLIRPLDLLLVINELAAQLRATPKAETAESEAPLPALPMPESALSGSAISEAQMTATDAAGLLEFLNTHGTLEISAISPTVPDHLPEVASLDVDGDQIIRPLDLLWLINTQEAGKSTSSEMDIAIQAHPPGPEFEPVAAFSPVPQPVRVAQAYQTCCHFGRSCQRLLRRIDGWIDEYTRQW